MSSVVADSATIVWWLGGQRHRLSDNAFNALADADAREGIYVSAVTLVDVWYATDKRNDPLTAADLVLIDEALGSNTINVHVLPVTVDIARTAWEPDRMTIRDPFDRIIASTARTHRLPLVTPDGVLRGLDLVTTIW